MPLDATARTRVGNQWMRENTAVMPAGVTKPTIAATVVAMDTWMDNNQASLIAALPVEFRPASGVPATVIADLFMFVLRRRVGKLRAEEDG